MACAHEFRMDRESSANAKHPGAACEFRGRSDADQTKVMDRVIDNLDQAVSLRSTESHGRPLADFAIYHASQVEPSRDVQKRMRDKGERVAVGSDQADQV